MSPRRQKTRAKIVGAAVELFFARGVASASVEEISEHAGFTRGAFYSNFADKDALVVAVAEESCGRIVDTAPAVLERIAASNPEPPVDDARSREIVLATVLEMLEGPAIDHRLVIVIRDLELYALRTPSLAKAIQEVQDECARYFSGVVAQGLVISGRELIVDPEDAIEYVMAAFTSMGFDEALRAAAAGHPATSFTSTLTRRLADIIVLMSRFTGR